MADPNEVLIGKWWNAEKKLPMTRVKFAINNKLTIARSLYERGSEETKNLFEMYLCKYKVEGNFLVIETLSRFKFFKDHQSSKNITMERDESPFLPFWDSNVIFSTPLRLPLEIKYMKEEPIIILDGQPFRKSNEDPLIEYVLPFKED